MVHHHLTSHHPSGGGGLGSTIAHYAVGAAVYRVGYLLPLPVLLVAVAALWWLFRRRR